MTTVLILLALGLMYALCLAPTPGTRQTPAGYFLKEGFSVAVTMANATAIQLWEVDIKPPGIDGGEPIAISNQHNAEWHTFFPRKLKTLTGMTGNAFYDPDAIPTIKAAVNTNTTITFFFSTGDTLCFYGTLHKWEPTDQKEGEAPKCSFTITPTNWDSANNVEAGPVYTAASGT